MAGSRTAGRGSLAGLLRCLSCQLSYRAREIFSKFLCSKATTPVNIDSQAQLADDVLRAPHPDMFKEQQLQVTAGCGSLWGVQARARGIGSTFKEHVVSGRPVDREHHRRR